MTVACAGNSKPEEKTQQQTQQAQKAPAEQSNSKSEWKCYPRARK